MPSGWPAPLRKRYSPSRPGPKRRSNASLSDKPTPPCRNRGQTPAALDAAILSPKKRAPDSAADEASARVEVSDLFPAVAARKCPWPIGSLSVRRMWPTNSPENASVRRLDRKAHWVRADHEAAVHFHRRHRGRNNRQRTWRLRSFAVVPIVTGPRRRQSILRIDPISHHETRRSDFSVPGSGFRRFPHTLDSCANAGHSAATG